jgi:hypothetical protein
MSAIDLNDVDRNIGHILVHFLYTGTYQALNNTDVSKQRAAMLTYLLLYRVLICDEHQHAVYSLDEHVERHHKLPIVQRRELLALYSSYTLLSSDQVPLPELPTTPFTELATPHPPKTPSWSK